MVMQKRRSWIVTIDQVEHRVDVVYAGLSGWMSIEVDGVRRARAWREFQTVFGGAVVSCALGRHRIEARVTQSWGSQDYAFALAIDGVIQPGSDPQPPPRALRGQTLKAIVLLALGIFVTGVVTTVLSRQ